MKLGRNLFKQFLRNWMLVIAMATGAGIYLTYHFCAALHFLGPALSRTASTIQPVLLFLMLFLTFCKVEPKDLKPQRWHLPLLLIQGGLYTALSAVLIAFPDVHLRYGIEAAMLCLICPTATACAVVTGKLGGNMAGVLSYTILINLLAAILIPLLVPLTNPVENLNFAKASASILSKVFPMLILPCLLAWAIRYFLPKFHARLLKYVYVSFYVWALALTLAIAMSTRYIILNENSLSALAVIAAVSLLCCAFQFFAGKKIGKAHGYGITAGQALGQKNTVFAIWLGYTFFNPIVSVAGGFYSIWHNCYNTWQLHRVAKKA